MSIAFGTPPGNDLVGISDPGGTPLVYYLILNMYQGFKKYTDKKMDGRVKVLPEQYPEVIALYRDLKSLRKVAKIFGVDKKIISFIVNPELKERDALRQKNQQHWKIYYDRDKHTVAIRKYRAKKRKLGIKYNSNKNE